mmetsp:Transcript_4633/g.15011  ORF Transcript_4633/g.15011 Transcript_4633/m.15011 type:complete len:271 (+) Transcript_4633:1645-2457(+)
MAVMEGRAVVTAAADAGVRRVAAAVGSDTPSKLGLRLKLALARAGRFHHRDVSLGTDVGHGTHEVSDGARLDSASLDSSPVEEGRRGQADGRGQRQRTTCLGDVTDTRVVRPRVGVATNARAKRPQLPNVRCVDLEKRADSSRPNNYLVDAVGGRPFGGGLAMTRPNFIVFAQIGGNEDSGMRKGSARSTCACDGQNHCPKVWFSDAKEGGEKGFLAEDWFVVRVVAQLGLPRSKDKARRVAIHCSLPNFHALLNVREEARPHARKGTCW